MKLKRLPEDFVVEELTDIVAQVQDRGPHTLYRLTKRDLGTLEAVEAIRRRWGLSGLQFHYGGLKDRHAETIQYLTIQNGPLKECRQERFLLEPLGRLPFSYGPKHFRGNRFAVTIRGLTPDALTLAEDRLKGLADEGLPNYFDDQRFGSVGVSKELIGLAWVRGDHEQALRLAIAEANPHDRPGVREEKAIVRRLWGQWADAKAELPRSHTRSLITYLADHPLDFRGAFARLRRELRTLYFSAFQSHLWNLMLARRIEQCSRPEQRIAIRLKLGEFPLHLRLDPDQAEALRRSRIPLPTSRTPEPEPGWRREAADFALSGTGLTWGDLKVRHLKDVFLSKGDRDAVILPLNPLHQQSDDELYPRRRKLTLEFELPKGAYATMLVKRLTIANE